MGVFLALDLFLFYVFFEVMLLPMYFLIAVWGGENREYAAIKFLLYTLFGSVFILVAILILYFWPGDAGAGRHGQRSRRTRFDIVELDPDRHRDGYYGRDDPELDLRPVPDRLLRQAAVVPVPHLAARRPRPGADADQHDPGRRPAQDRRLRPDPPGLAAGPAGAYDWSYFVAALGVFSILYGALVAMAQTDFKKLVAYSSVSHMGYVTLGMAVMSLTPATRGTTPTASTARCS